MLITLEPLAGIVRCGRRGRCSERPDPDGSSTWLDSMRSTHWTSLQTTEGEGVLRTVTIGLLIIAVLVAVIALGPKARPAWADPVLEKPKREKQWDWYRTSGLRSASAA